MEFPPEFRGVLRTGLSDRRAEDAAIPRLALLANLQAKPGKADEVARFLASALPLAQAETGTTRWFALRLIPECFGIFDTFDAESGHQATSTARSQLL